MVPIDMMVTSVRLVLVRKLSDSHDHISDIEFFEERRHNAKNKWLSYQKHISKNIQYE